jgi:hypothetical protein
LVLVVLEQPVEVQMALMVAILYFLLSHPQVAVVAHPSM